MKRIGSLYFPDVEEHFQRFADDIEGYQKPQRDKAYDYVTTWRTAIDVGANVGIFSKDFARRFDRVISIEPLDENVECLRLNLPENAEIVQAAAGDRPGVVQMLKTRRSLGHAMIVDHDEVETPAALVLSEPERLTRVEMIPVDRLQASEVGLIKLDIQGAEVIALKGAEQTIRTWRPVVLIEEKPVGKKGGSTAHIEAAAALLASYGMVPRERVGADRIYVFP